METEPELFDATEAEARKQEGMSRAAVAHPDLLMIARRAAHFLAVRHGVVNSDMVGRRLQSEYGIKTLGTVGGSVFRSDEWEWTGEYVKSVRTSNHGRMIRLWRFVGE